jgi:hypothetical protein
MRNSACDAGARRCELALRRGSTRLDRATARWRALYAQIASRFGVVVTQKVAAQAVPVIGALGGAAVNYAFIDHFQEVARAHFVWLSLRRPPSHT